MVKKKVLTERGQWTSDGTVMIKPVRIHWLSHRGLLILQPSQSTITHLGDQQLLVLGTAEMVIPLTMDCSNGPGGCIIIMVLIDYNSPNKNRMIVLVIAKRIYYNYSSN